MDMKLSVSILAIVFATVSPQFQNVQVPPGAFVELEFEFINQQPGAGGQQGGAGAGMGQGSGMAGGGMSPGGGAGGSGSGMGMGMPGMKPGQMPQMMAPSQMMPPMSGASPMMQGMMPGMQPEMMPMAGSMMAQMMPTSQMMPGMGMAGGAPSSPIQQLLSNMVQMVTSLRQMHGFNMPMPPMEEPCPCDAECCKLPTEPRRLLPVLEIPMVMHRGCCGCVDCPNSLSPLINGMVQAAQMATAQQGPPPDL